MGATLRALRALVLLAGFYVLSTGLLAVLAGVFGVIVYESFQGHLALLFLGKLLVVPLLLTFPIIRGVFMFRGGKGDEGPPGLTVDDTQQPELWAEVRDLARQAGTRPPRDITLTGQVNAGVSERAHLLGLLPGRRRLFLGVPLMTGLGVPHLRAVLAHELGHYSNRDTRLAGITMRGRDSVVRTIESFHVQAAANDSASHAVLARIYTGYAKLYMRASQSVGRRQELAADRAAARIVGRDAAAGALREIPVLDAAFDFYVSRYATLGWDVELLPPTGEFYGGLRHLLADPDRRTELAGLRAELPEPEHSPYDSHPPIAERVRLLEALPDDGVRDDPDAPSALTLLRDPDGVLAALETATLAAGAARMRHVSWEALASQAGLATFRAGARPLQQAAAGAGHAAERGLASLDEILDAIDAGRLWAIADRLPKSPEAAAVTGRAAREFARPALRSGLSMLTCVTLADAGKADWTLSWSTPARLTLPDGYDEALPEALDAAVTDDPDTGPLRELLAGALPLIQEP
ncbi:M48 family metalloprotease [Streptomyces sp. So13.3]|uniref:M48 family metalloprotease n=1 Tax=Streptomyces TaxID=1883 RepID=UPI00110677BA|nr:MULTISPECIES: M48 family metallopeptidase [Streptomyces]MCZ4100416.1 M48 family metalloprotease [Streptomyces sp. H39-C1]QNA75007.1 M48 family metalloprotease [Streptomyces sp. So13.3]